MRKILSLMMALVMALSLSPMAMAESFTDGTYTGSGKGMMGNIEVSVTVEGGKITAVEVTSQSETARHQRSCPGDHSPGYRGCPELGS